MQPIITETHQCYHFLQMWRTTGVEMNSKVNKERLADECSSILEPNALAGGRHGDAAVKLQRDWNQDPQSLPFAQHIKTHALVRLVQKGLQYYEIEQSINQDGDHFLAKAFFGPDARRATSSPRADASQDESIDKPQGSPRTRKHGREPSTANGVTLQTPLAAAPATKKRRNNPNPTTANEPAMTNGIHKDSDSMDLDQNGFAQHEPPEPRSLNSPADDGQTAAEGTIMDVTDDALEPDDPRMTLTDGPSVGVQSDKVAELGTETSVLGLPQRNVLHAAWSPTDPQLLAVAGDALCRIWTLTKTPDRPNPNRHFVDILEQGDDSAVTAMAWSPNGQTLAIATKSDDTDRPGEISLWSKDGKSLDNLLAAQDMVIGFRWNPAGTLLLGITSSGSGSSALTIWDVHTSQSLPPFLIDHIITDAAWYDDHRFLVCGHSFVADCVVDLYNSLSFHDRTNEDLHRNWIYARYDAITQSMAIAAEETADLAILTSTGHSRTTAHSAEITAIAFQPISNPPPYSDSSPRRLATSSLDGDIRIWDVTNPFSILHEVHLGRSNPAMAIRFTPDGYLFAAASANRVLIFNAETRGVPRAVWRGESLITTSGTGFGSKIEDGNGAMIMDGDSGIGEEDEGGTHSLTWDVDGARLAYSMGSQDASDTPRRMNRRDQRFL
ncbi:MAG: hypothetical protein Q9181_004706 [Wetmoreana brouardii]